MDAAGHAAALTYVRSRSAGRTVLLVTHDPADALTLDAEAIVLRDHLAAHDASAESD